MKKINTLLAGLGAILGVGFPAQDIKPRHQKSLPSYAHLPPSEGYMMSHGSLVSKDAAKLQRRKLIREMGFRQYKRQGYQANYRAFKEI